MAVYDYSGLITGTQTVDATIAALVTFEGQQAYENRAKTTGTNTAAGQTIAVDTEGRYYSRRTGDNEISQYGSVIEARSQTAGIAFTTTTRTVFNPPWVDNRYSLAVGQSVVQTYTGTTTSTSSFPGAPPVVVTTTNSTTVRFVGIENITVPAGTYSTCKFEEFATGQPSAVTTNWLVVGKGVLAKAESVTAEGTQTIRATSLRLNGAPF